MNSQPPMPPSLHHRNALPPGFELEEYQIESVLGHGGFGITYLATDLRLQQWVAIKEYLPNELAVREGVTTVFAKSSSDEEAFQWGLQRFILEARTLAHFKHPNIVRVARFFERHGTAYMVMEYQEGQSLKEYCKERDFSQTDLENLLFPLLDGLEQVHAAGFLHRDIKPNNIYIRNDHSPVLLDFGAARFAVGQRSSSLTSIVTPGYAPFEQYDTKSLQGPWTDIYAMGAVMYFLITGGPPQEVVSRIKHDEMPRATEVGQDRFGAEFLQAIDWSLAVDEEARPQSVAEWRQALRATPLDIFPAPAPAALAMPPISPWIWGGMAALGIALALGGYWFFHAPPAAKPLAPVIAEAPPIAPAQREQVETFIQRYIEAQAQADLAAFIPLFDELVDYYSWGQVSREAVQNEKREFWDKWPSIDYTVIGPVSIARDPKYPDILHVDFPIEFEARNPEAEPGPATSRGKAVQIWQLRLTQNGLKIAKETQRRLKRQKIYQ